MLLRGGFFLWRVDPGDGGQGWWPGGEPLGMLAVGGSQHAGPADLDGCGGAVVNVGGGVQAQARVPVLGVIPGEEGLAVCPGGLDRGEAGRESGPVFEGLELRF